MGDLIGLAAVVMIFGIPLLAIWTRHQKEMRQHDGRQQDGMAEGDARRLIDQVEALQERVQVLERIVTDRSHDVASQIEALRDTRRVEDLLENHVGKEASR